MNNYCHCKVCCGFGEDENEAEDSWWEEDEYFDVNDPVCPFCFQKLDWCECENGELE